MSGERGDISQGPTMEQDAANREKTDGLSVRQILTTIRDRLSVGKPVGRLLAAAGQRRHALEREGYTGATNADLHALNVARTSGMSNSEIASSIKSRQEAGLPTGQLEAAARQRGIKY